MLELCVWLLTFARFAVASGLRLSSPRLGRRDDGTRLRALFPFEAFCVLLCQELLLQPKRLGS